MFAENSKKYEDQKKELETIMNKASAELVQREQYDYK